MCTIKENGKELLEMGSMHNSQDVEAPLVPINEKMGKPSVVFMYNGILLCLKEN